MLLRKFCVCKNDFLCSILLDYFLKVCFGLYNMYFFKNRNLKGIEIWKYKSF